MSDNVENNNSMISAYTRISPDSNDLHFIKIVKFQRQADKTPTSIPFPTTLPNNTSTSNNNNNTIQDLSDGKRVQLGKKIMERLYTVGILSRNVIQKCRKNSSTISSPESSVIESSSSSSTQDSINHSVLPVSNNGSENGENGHILPSSPTSTSSAMSTSNSTLSKTSDTSSPPSANGKKKRGRKRKLSLDDKQTEIDNCKIYNCKIKLNMSHGDEKFHVRLQFVYKTKPKVFTSHNNNNRKNNNYISSGNHSRNGSYNYNGNGVNSKETNSSFSRNNNASPNGLNRLLNPSTTETPNLSNGHTNHSLSTNGSIIPLEEEKVPNMYITFDELINYLRDKIFFPENKKNLRGIEVKINYLLQLCSFKCLINGTEIDI